MAINFPNSPALNQIYTFNGLSWRWTGSSWTGLGTAVIGATGATGATGPIGPTGPTGAAGKDGQSSSFYKYTAETATTSPVPGSGKVIWNNAAQSSATQLYVSHMTNDGTDIDVFLALIKAGDTVILQDENDSNNYQIWKVSGAVSVVSNSYVTIPVSFSSSSGWSATNNQKMILVVIGGVALNYVETLNGFTGPVTATVGYGLSVTNTNKTITFFNTGVTGFNGLTGNVTGVTGVNSGTGISVTGTTTNPTVTNTGVLSIGGQTGIVGFSPLAGLTWAPSNPFNTLSINFLFGGATFAPMGGKPLNQDQFLIQRGLTMYTVSAGSVMTTASTIGADLSLSPTFNRSSFSFIGEDTGTTQKIAATTVVNSLITNIDCGFYSDVVP